MPVISVNAANVKAAEEIAEKLGRQAGKVTSALFRHHLQQNSIDHKEHQDETTVPPGHHYFKL